MIDMAHCISIVFVFHAVIVTTGLNHVRTHINFRLKKSFLSISQGNIEPKNEGGDLDSFKLYL